jgi:UPF0755 protein
MKRLKTKLLVLGGASTLVLLAVVVLAVGKHLLLEAPKGDPNGAPQKFRVAPGESFHSVSDRLQKEGHILSATRFRILARLHGADRSIRPGTYLFYPARPPADLLDDLVQGRLLMHRVTIPEGWRLEQIAAETERVLGIPASVFLAKAADPNRLLSAGSRAGTVEGYLFPETYFFEDGVGADTVIDEMMARFEANWSRISLGVDSLPLGLDRHGIVTLASIVEAETGVPSERSRIAAVYLNRLAEDWKLQADPTVRYALGKHDRAVVLYKDLEAKHPYNTYWIRGLPPGPIGSPGAAAIEAAIHPLRPCDDFFFVASGDGGHVFSKTMRDHNLAKGAAKKKARAEAARSGGARLDGARRSG